MNLSKQSASDVKSTYTEGKDAMNNYQNKTIAELLYIQKDAYEAAQCAQANGDKVAESKYLDQVNDSASELYKRRKGV